ncbi:hypothetical protein VHUM_02401 [Vanrija humicola]|uniref:Uncharacterized protein n=1 Tax=Vanrija humicola TaxID=5417 RepID=A0A7D8ZME0_VANHU|nr:hypothetical protein VHUM_02401 [Vanrija humicola]
MPTPPSLLKRQISGALSPAVPTPITTAARSLPTSPVTRFAPLSPTVASSRASSVPAETPTTTPTTPEESVKQLEIALAQVAQTVS